LTDYNKSPKTTEELIALLKTKDIQCSDEIKSTKRLQNISYYKLSGYKKAIDSPKTLEEIIHSYELDMDLRVAVLGLLAYYEIALKNSFVQISLNIEESDISPYPKSHFYLSKTLFKTIPFSDNLDRLTKDIKNNYPKLAFIDFYKKKYDSPELPPIWMIIELMSFGDICKWITSINHRKYINIIPNKFGFKNITEFNNVVITCTTLRNMCAHHARLYNNNIYGTRIPLDGVPDKLKNILKDKGLHKKLWNVIVLVIYSLNNINHKRETDYFIDTFKFIFSEYGNNKHQSYAFPNNWYDQLKSLAE